MYDVPPPFAAVVSLLNVYPLTTEGFVLLVPVVLVDNTVFILLVLI